MLSTPLTVHEIVPRGKHTSNRIGRTLAGEVNREFGLKFWNCYLVRQQISEECKKNKPKHCKYNDWEEHMGTKSKE